MMDAKIFSALNAEKVNCDYWIKENGVRIANSKSNIEKMEKEIAIMKERLAQIELLVNIGNITFKEDGNE